MVGCADKAIASLLLTPCHWLFLFAAAWQTTAATAIRLFVTFMFSTRHCSGCRHHFVAARLDFVGFATAKHFSQAQCTFAALFGRHPGCRIGQWFCSLHCLLCHCCGFIHDFFLDLFTFALTAFQSFPTRTSGCVNSFARLANSRRCSLLTLM